MATRTSETTVTFRHPFTLPPLDGPQPAGTYRLVFDEEEVPGLSFLAFRRTATLLHLPAIAISPYPSQVLAVLPADLEAAIAADAHA